MNYKSFNLGDWIGHIGGVIEDETTLDGNEMRDLVEFLSTLKQEPCDDAISRSSVFEIMGNLMSIPYDFDRPINEKDVSESMDEIRALPPATPTRKKGKWITLEDDWGDITEAVCSCCDANGNHKWGYCPYCGAEMESEE